MNPDILERSFEETIECALLANGPDACPGEGIKVRETSLPFGDMASGGYHRPRAEDYDRSLCLLPRDVVDFLLGTQPDNWKRLEEYHGGEVKDRFLKRLSREIARCGTLDVLRSGVRDSGCKFEVAYFRPSSGLNPELRRKHAANLVYVTTRLAGPATNFLPFNRGRFGGAGNPPVPPTQNGYSTQYFWEETWAHDSVLDLVRRFIHEVEEEDDGGRKTGKRFLIFPRYHQLDTVRPLVLHARSFGPGQRSLVQHSAGSGKSFTIAWLAHRLAHSTTQTTGGSSTRSSSSPTGACSTDSCRGPSASSSRPSTWSRASTPPRGNSRRRSNRGRRSSSPRSRLHAVRYKLALDACLEEKGHPWRTLVAFSGTVRDGGMDYAEAGMNGVSDLQIARTFGRGEYRFLVVANKFQYGFDQPLLHTIYVDVFARVYFGDRATQEKIYAALSVFVERFGDLSGE